MVVSSKPNSARINDADLNPDPITGEPGSHPVGTGLGAAGGAAAGAAIGTMAGPIGTLTGGVVGAVVGGIAGGYAGKGIAELVNPTDEDAYWAENYSSRPYVEEGVSYSTYQPAYRYGYESRSKYADREFDQVEPEISREWDKARGNSNLGWSHARDAVRDAYDRTGQVYQERLRSRTDGSTGSNA